MLELTETEHPKNWDIKNPSFEIPIWESRKKMSFGCSFCGIL
jgi:hypothetical protein